MKKRLTSYYTIWCVVVIVSLFPALVSGQDTGVSAEAQVRANLRANTDVSSNLLGEIVSGTRYPVIGRSEFFPWLLLADPSSRQPIGWVFQDLVTVYGDVNTVPISKVVVSNSLPTPTFAPAFTLAPSETFQLQGVAL